MVELRNKHGGHTVKHRTPFLVNGCKGNKRIKFFDHHLRAAVSEAAHGGQHHSEAVKQRHAYTTFIIGGKLHVYSGEVTVVHYVVMCEHNSFRKSGCARGILHIDHILTASQSAKPFEFIVIHVIPQQQNFGRVVHSPILFLPDINHVFQFRKAFASELAALSGFQFGHQIVNNIRIIVSGSSVGHAKGVHIRILEQIGHFFGFVACVYRDSNSTDFGGSIEESQPVGYILRPYPYIRSAGYPNCYQPFGHIVHTFVEGFPAETQVAVGINDIFLIGRFGCPVLKPVAQCSVGKMH